MTIEQLIKELQTYPLDTEVLFRASIECHRSTSICDKGHEMIEFEENFKYENEDGELKCGNVLNFTVFGTETDWD